MSPILTSAGQASSIWWSVTSRPGGFGPGMVAHAPGGAIHGYQIKADGTRFLTILSSGNGHAFFRQMDAEVSFPPNLEDVVRVAADHGIRFAG